VGGMPPEIIKVRGAKSRGCGKKRDKTRKFKEVQLFENDTGGKSMSPKSKQ